MVLAVTEREAERWLVTPDEGTSDAEEGKRNGDAELAVLDCLGGRTAGVHDRRKLPRLGGCWSHERDRNLPVAGTILVLEAVGRAPAVEGEGRKVACKVAKLDDEFDPTRVAANE